ncbi:hypothetical protein VMCG_01293 [Cytospora schulzeri]|uniref:Fungal N-terminal domain-containing protein n=1 Tax=Cytospora schulzeri TaxID=448051 RepID=A0A423X786_9PEZI|nr:hypothetical protein VMCG_01293 [Valsa malicola]
MADAIGLAASVAGLVSLGLQVAGGIGSYIDGVKARKEELAAVSTRVRHMHGSIEVLRNAIPDLSASNQAASSAATSVMKTCEEELGALADVLQGLLDFPALEHGLKDSIREQKKKLTYPFHRPSLNNLERRLDSTNNVLQTAIQALELTVMSCIDKTVSVVDSKVNNNKRDMLVLLSESKATNTSISGMKASLDTSNATAASIKQDLHTVLPQKADIRDLTTVTQRTLDSVVISSERTEQHYSTLATTLSALTADTMCKSDLERAHMRRFEDRFDRIDGLLQTLLGTHTGSDLNHLTLVG